MHASIPRYDDGLQRLCAALLTALFSLTLILPALSPDPDSQLPPCCRRDGKHGCAMMACKRLRESSSPAFRSSLVCPAYPTGHATPAVSKTALAATEAEDVAPALSHPKLIAQTEARRRQSARRAWQVRGPPALL